MKKQKIVLLFRAVDLAELVQQRSVSACNRQNPDAGIFSFLLKLCVFGSEPPRVPTSSKEKQIVQQFAAVLLVPVSAQNTKQLGNSFRFWLDLAIKKNFMVEFHQQLQSKMVELV